MKARIKCAIAIGAAVTGWVVNLPAAPKTTRAAAALLKDQPRVVAVLESRLGRVGTDLVLSASTAAANGLTQAVGTPMLLSNNRASVELFGEAATFTDNTAPDIRRALELLRSRRDKLRLAAELKRRELGERWSASARDLASVINREQVPASR